jgi:hypothetical protein
MTAEMGDRARRFTWLVDILYDHRVKLLASAAVPPWDLYWEGPNSQEFSRTASRLIEMQTREYMARRTSPAIAVPTSVRLRPMRARRPDATLSFLPLRIHHADLQRHHGETPLQNFKAYRTFQENDKVVSRFVDMKPDELDPGDVLVRTKYSTINYKDALSYNGTGKIMRKYPTNAGIDMAGTVESSQDTRWKRGDKVIVHAYDMGVAHDGGYAEYVRVQATGSCDVPRA